MKRGCRRMRIVCLRRTDGGARLGPFLRSSGGKAGFLRGKTGIIFSIFYEEGGARADVCACIGDAEHHVGEFKLSSWKGCGHVSASGGCGVARAIAEIVAGCGG